MNQSTIDIMQQYVNNLTTDTPLIVREYLRYRTGANIFFGIFNLAVAIFAFRCGVICVKQKIKDDTDGMVAFIFLIVGCLMLFLSLGNFQSLWNIYAAPRVFIAEKIVEINKNNKDNK